MNTPRTHYDALGLQRNATAKEIRDAHRDLARLLHPDHLAQVDLSASDRTLAEKRIRDVNEAWRILGDPSRRASYDRALGPEPLQWEPPWEHAAPSRPVRRAARPAATTSSGGGVFPWWPLLACGIVLLVAILVLVLLVGSTGSRPTRERPIAEHACVTIAPGPSTSVVSCSTPNDGRIVAFVATAAECPAGSTVRRLSSEAASLACLKPSDQP